MILRKADFTKYRTSMISGFTKYSESSWFPRDQRGNTTGASWIVGWTGVGTLGAEEVATPLTNPGTTAAGENSAGLALVEVVGLVATERTHKAANSWLISHVVIE
jgi:hypothetical protein